MEFALNFRLSLERIYQNKDEQSEASGLERDPVDRRFGEKSRSGLLSNTTDFAKGEGR